MNANEDSFKLRNLVFNNIAKVVVFKLLKYQSYRKFVYKKSDMKKINKREKLANFLFSSRIYKEAD